LDTIENIWKHIILPVIVVSGIGILVGFIFNRNQIFIPTMRSFQFTESSVTAGLAYTIFKKPTLRNIWVALFIWDIFLTVLKVKVIAFKNI